MTAAAAAAHDILQTLGLIGVERICHPCCGGGCPSGVHIVTWLLLSCQVEDGVFHPATQPVLLLDAVRYYATRNTCRSLHYRLGRAPTTKRNDARETCAIERHWLAVI